MFQDRLFTVKTILSHIEKNLDDQRTECVGVAIRNFFVFVKSKETLSRSTSSCFGKRKKTSASRDLELAS